MKYIKLRLLNIVMNYYFNKYQMTINSAVTKKGKNVMNEKLETKKYSIFGRYDFIENTPDNVAKLYQEFGKMGFMPNMIPLIKIEQPQNNVCQLMRPQLVNSELQCTITILPERIDVEGGDIDITKTADYLNRLVSIFELKINRIALNTTTFLKNLTTQEERMLKDRIAAPANYEGEGELIEYASHRVSRKDIECLGEKINVGRNITGITSVSGNRIVIDQVRIDTDINTLGELTNERFNVQNCTEFFRVAEKSSHDITNNIMEEFDAIRS